MIKAVIFDFFGVLYTQDSEPNQLLLDFIRKELKPKYKLGVISNAGDNWPEKLLLQEDTELFDDIILSYQFEFSKPDARIYELAAKRLQVKPSECVFVDDIGSYCDGAKDAGMRAVLYETFEQTKTDLEQILQ